MEPWDPKKRAEILSPHRGDGAGKGLSPGLYVVALRGSRVPPPSLLQPACWTRLQTWSAAMRDMIPLTYALIKWNLSLLSMDAEGGAEAGA